MISCNKEVRVIPCINKLCALTCTIFFSCTVFAHGNYGHNDNSWLSPAPVEDTNPDPHILETTIVAQEATVDLDGNGLLANVYTYNGTVPGPQFHVNVGDTVIVHFENQLPDPSSIHWHGIEVNNPSDGTTVTQNRVATGETYTYKFIAPRPGVFWYHSHFKPSNPEFKGLYGSFIVSDKNEKKLIGENILPDKKNTTTLVLGDTTVCKEEGSNDTATFPNDPALPWSGGGTFPGNLAGPTPEDLCENPRDNDGNFLGTGALAAGTIPNIQPPEDCGQADTPTCRTNVGQLVLVNGHVPAGRAGTPEAPGDIAVGAKTWKVSKGEGIRLRMISTTVFRYFRLLLTDQNGQQINLYRVGGEGGLLDQVRLEGGIEGTLDNKYETGEILLAPSDRTDVVFAVPDAEIGDVLTLWTLDYSHTGTGFANTPSVPVMHFEIAKQHKDKHGHEKDHDCDRHGRSHGHRECDYHDDHYARDKRDDHDHGWQKKLHGLFVNLFPHRDKGSQHEGGSHHNNSDYQIDETVLLLADPLINDPVEDIKSLPTNVLLDPATFATPLPGSADETIRLTTSGGRPSIDGIVGHFEASAIDFTTIPHADSSRYTQIGDLLELTVANQTSAHHPFHMHGFSFQPIRMEDSSGTTVLTYPYNEFVDSFDIQPQHSLVFRVRIDDRPMQDGTTPGGAIGRWVFHCHIFFHAALGMISELVVVSPDVFSSLSNSAPLPAETSSTPPISQDEEPGSDDKQTAANDNNSRENGTSAGLGQISTIFIVLLAVVALCRRKKLSRI